MRILIRTSKWAILARRLGWLSVPLIVIPVIMHRQGYLDSRTFLVVVLFAGAVAALTVLVSVIALVRLWYSGDQGWNRALSGLFFGLICVSPFLWYGSLALRTPAVTDISTVPRDELPLILEPDTASMPPSRVLTQQEQRRYFPNVATRTYPLDAFQLFAIVEHLVEGQGWDIRYRREPSAEDDPGRLNARIVTLPGWREEVVLRVLGVSGGASVDMRSASIGAPLDMGSNGERITDYLAMLDAEVTAFIRDNASVEPAPVQDSEGQAPDDQADG